MAQNVENQGANADQARYWQSEGGRKWVDLQEPLDTALAPVSAALFERARPAPSEQVLDLGCGTGSTTLALAERVGSGGKVVGLDISPVLLARARARTPAALASRIEYVQADAQTADLGGRHFDLLVSRFGSMFFADPPAAFHNLRQGLRAGARLHLAAWAALAANPWFAIPVSAAIARLGPPPPVDPRTPGPLAFAEIDYVLGILQAAGFSQPAAEVAELQLAPSGDVQQVAALALSTAPTGRLMTHYEATLADAEAIGQTTEREFARFATADGLRIPTQLNFFSAVAP